MAAWRRNPTAQHNYKGSAQAGAVHITCKPFAHKDFGVASGLEFLRALPLNLTVRWHASADATSAPKSPQTRPQ